MNQKEEKLPEVQPTRGGEKKERPSPTSGKEVGGICLVKGSRKLEAKKL